MLSLATHELNFRVLREDVFFQDGSNTGCRNCGQEGHYAAQCTNAFRPPEEVVKKPPVEKKPFIWLDVAILREYLEIELNVPSLPFPFDLELAIDDWVLLIFFVGNDFLPHLPSLEIREGAIDTLLKIWKDELPRFGGYLTHHGHLELSRVQVMFEGLASRETDIFKRRREGPRAFVALPERFPKLTLSFCQPSNGRTKMPNAENWKKMESRSTDLGPLARHHRLCGPHPPLRSLPRQTVNRTRCTSRVSRPGQAAITTWSPIDMRFAWPT